MEVLDIILLSIIYVNSSYQNLNYVNIMPKLLGKVRLNISGNDIIFNHVVVLPY
jgi:hypothetical protein